jgi:D-threonine aldolase
LSPAKHPGVIAELSSINSPSLIFFEKIIIENIDRMVEIAESPERLWPHIKTHKSPAIVSILLQKGISSFKCATIAEAEMLASTGAKNVLIAYPLVGPNISRFSSLISLFPDTRFHALVDSEKAVSLLTNELTSRGQSAGGFVDIDAGMRRTGVPMEKAAAVYRSLSSSNALSVSGLHVYDGHNTQQDPEERQAACDLCYHRVEELKRDLEERGLQVPHMIFGGTPTFACYAGIPDTDLSPGTAVLYDWGYSERYPDLPFEPAALVLGRVISISGNKRFTLDVGSKAIATDPAGQKGLIVEFPDAVPISQSEEHWVFESDSDPKLRSGDTVTIIPTHICPTVNLYEEALLIGDGGKVIDRWPIVARSRRLTI